MLHSSLLELNAQAISCTSDAMIKEILGETTQLARNAIDHGTHAEELSRWISDTITYTLHSPAAQELTGGATIVVTGSYGRGCGRVWSPIHFFAVTGPQCSSVDVETLVRVFSSEDFTLTPVAGFPPADRHEWEQRIATAVRERDGHSLGWFADAGSFMTPLVCQAESSQCLWEQAIAHRPPAIKLHDGLPDKNSFVDITNHLIEPLADLARWAAIAARTDETNTSRRIEIAASSGIITAAEADYLRQAWDAGLELLFTRWFEGSSPRSATWGMMPQIQRSTFGAASRLLSDVIASIEDRRGNAQHSSPQ